MLTIFSVPAFNDNYIWILIDTSPNQAIVVDPGDAKPVFDFFNQHNLALKAILVTHKHHDHTGGISELLSAFPDAHVYSNKVDNIAQTTQFVSQDDLIKINHNEFKVIEIPGHTLGHVAYYCKPYLFCGDTLFTNGCGRVFEDTAKQMLSSLKKLMCLPDDTLVYCGHEYTQSNIKFALQVEPNNFELQKRFEATNALRAQHKPTVPSTLQLEKATNPFLRCDSEEIIRTVSHHVNKKLDNDIDVFSEMREWKNKF